MKELNRHDLERVRRMLPKEVRELIKGSNGIHFLAGGFIRAVICGEEPADIDLFTANKSSASLLAHGLKEKLAQTNSHARLIETDNAFTVLGLKYPVQIIHRWTFDTPQQCVESFDFTIASAAVYWDQNLVVDHVSHPHAGWTSCCDDTFYEDLAAKRLVYRNPVRNEDAGGSMLRLLKFSRMGYSGPLKTVADVMARLSAGVKPERLSNRVDMGKLYLGLLREVDPLAAGEFDADV